MFGRSSCESRACRPGSELLWPLDGDYLTTEAASSGLFLSAAHELRRGALRVREPALLILIRGHRCDHCTRSCGSRNVVARRGCRAIDRYAREARLMQARHWLDYDSVAFAVLVVWMGAIELLATYTVPK